MLLLLLLLLQPPAPCQIKLPRGTSCS